MSGGGNDEEYFQDIYEYDIASSEWFRLGETIKYRRDHGMSLISIKEVTDYCCFDTTQTCQ